MSPAPATSAARRPLILIVDDMEDIRDLYSVYLSREGFRPECATNGFEALSKALVMGPDVIVMDLNLPELDGWEATRRYQRHHPETQTALGETPEGRFISRLSPPSSGRPACWPG